MLEHWHGRTMLEHWHGRTMLEHWHGRTMLEHWHGRTMLEHWTVLKALGVLRRLEQRTMTIVRFAVQK